MSIKKKILAGTASIIGGLFLLSGVAFAAPGDAVQPPIANPDGCIGIGVAYDGTDILYTCAGVPEIKRTDLTGANLTDVTTLDAANGVTPVTVDAIAWDSNENMLWGGDLDGAGKCRIWSIDMATGLATLRFSFADIHGGCGPEFLFFDGITIDTVTDTIWLSPDIHTFIHHYDKLGNEIVADLINFSALTPAGEPDVNSGLAIGLDGNLFAGTAFNSKIVQLDPVTPAFIGVFANVAGRDEDLECGPEVEGVETLLSRTFEDGHIDVLEVPEGTCVSPVRPLVPACVETVNPHGKTVPPAGSTTLPGPKGGQNEDGFYELGIEEKFQVGSTLWVTDAAGSGPFGPFNPGDKVKITEAPGGIASSKKMGSTNTNGKAGAIVAHITLTGDALVFAIDPAGVKHGPVSCLVPPPPK